MKSKKKKGFTLIELIIVIAIIAVLASIAIPKYQNSNLKAKAAAHNANVVILKNAAASFLADNPNATAISDTDILNYIEGGKMPKTYNDGTFKVELDGNKNIIVSPGMVEIKNNNIVETKWF